MANENEGASAPGSDTAVDTTVVATTAQVSEEANPSKQDWAQFKKDQRELVSTFKALAEAMVKQDNRTVAPAKPAAQASVSTSAGADAIADRLATLEREAKLLTVYADHGIKPGPQRDFIEANAKHVPADGLRAFVEGYLKTIPENVAAPVTIAVAPVNGKSNAGAPGTTGARADTSDLGSVDPEVFKSLPLEERRARYEAYSSRGPNVNPYAGARTRQLTKPGKK